MRTTLTVDDDVAVQLQALRSRDQRSFKQVVNEVLRAGLAHLERAEPSQPQGPFTHATSLGQHRLPDLDDVSEALAVAEGERHR